MDAFEQTHEEVLSLDPSMGIAFDTKSWPTKIN